MSLVMKSFATSAILLLLSATSWSQHALVLQSDFGNKDAAVPSMKGVAVGVSADIDIYDLTHEIPVFNIWEASLRLVQTASYWPAGTVFVSVVDPGVGTERLSVVLKTDTGHYFVSPDNGSLTAVAEEMGIAAVREIDEAVNRLKNSEMSMFMPIPVHGWRPESLPLSRLAGSYRRRCFQSHIRKQASTKEPCPAIFRFSIFSTATFGRISTEKYFSVSGRIRVMTSM